MTEKSESERYLIEPENKKSVYEEQSWSNTLKNGLGVTVKVGNLYRWGSFYINLNEKEKKDLLNKDTILINEYDDFELVEMWDGGCDFWVDILDEDDYTEEELQEIHNLIYNSGKENENNDGYDEEKMITNGWTEIDYEYIIVSPITLHKVKE